MNEQYVLEADPKRPYKLYATILVGSLSALLGYADVLPIWAVVVINTVLGGLAVFITPNPLRVKEGRPVNQDDPLF